MSDSGLLLVCTERFVVGQILNLACDSAQGRSLSCTVRVCHHDENAMGVAIIEIAAQSADGYQLRTEVCCVEA